MSGAIGTRLVGVEAEVAGFTEVEEARLAKVLGPNSWHVLQVLWERRDRQGMTHATIRGIAHAAGYQTIHEKAVKRALARLSEAQLVVNIGWRLMRVPTAHGRYLRKVFCRTVFGARLLSGPNEKSFCAVPSDAREWLKTAKYRGGKRAGSGRKGPECASDGGVYSSFKPVFKVSPSLSKCPLQPVFKVSPLSNTYSNRGEKRGEKREMRSSPNGDEAALTARVSFSSFETEEGTGIGGGRISSPPCISTTLPGVPPYPGASVVQPARVPDPPKLTECKNESQRVRMLVLAFRAAMALQLRTKKKSYAFENITPRSKYWGVFVRAARLLIEFDVSPYAWCVWKVRQWYNIKTHETGHVKGSPVRPPPLAFMFNEKKITARVAEEKDRFVVVESALGGRVIFGARHKALIRVYEKMRAAILTGTPPAEAVKKFFPRSKYTDMVEAAKLEAVETRVRIEQRIARGEFVWV